MHELGGMILNVVVSFISSPQQLDPITGAPRYGENTMNRVQELLKTYDSMLEAFKVVFGDSDKLNEGNVSITVIDDMKETLKAQQEAQQQKKQEELATKESQMLKEQAEHQARLDDEDKQQQEARWLHDREVEGLSRAAEASRLARQNVQLEQRRQQEESERLDRDWVASIMKGEQGIRKYLALLRASTTPGDCTTALTALHTLFSQILAHPEETKFRRVRRDHPKFTEDIGRHPGGKELLIASGFRLGKIDEIPSYISSEPNLEKEMDAWADWFDLKKQSLDCIEEEMLK